MSTVFDGFGAQIAPIVSGLFAMYLLISSNFLGELFSNSLQRLLNNNFFVKHGLAFLTMFFSISLVLPLPDDMSESVYIGYMCAATVALYILFTLSNRITPVSQIMVVILLFLVYVLHVDIQHRDKLIAGSQRQGAT